MTEQDAFDIIVSAVRIPLHRVPRDPATIGATWPIFSYRSGNTTVQVMDEGRTVQINSPVVIVAQSNRRPLVFISGTPAALASLAQSCLNPNPAP